MESVGVSWSALLLPTLESPALHGHLLCTDGSETRSRSHEGRVISIGSIVLAFGEFTLPKDFLSYKETQCKAPLKHLYFHCTVKYTQRRSNHNVTLIWSSLNGSSWWGVLTGMKSAPQIRLAYIFIKCEMSCKEVMEPKSLLQQEGVSRCPLGLSSVHLHCLFIGKLDEHLGSFFNLQWPQD